MYAESGHILTDMSSRVVPQEVLLSQQTLRQEFFVFLRRNPDENALEILAQPRRRRKDC